MALKLPEADDGISGGLDDAGAGPLEPYRRESALIFPPGLSS